MTVFAYDVRDMKARTIGDMQNVVTSLTFVIQAVQGDVMRESFFPVELDPPPAGQFQPFDTLTKQQVVDWAVQKVGQAQIDALKHGLESVIAEYIQSDEYAVKSVEPPWSA